MNIINIDLDAACMKPITLAKIARIFVQDHSRGISPVVAGSVPAGLPCGVAKKMERK